MSETPIFTRAKKQEEDDFDFELMFRWFLRVLIGAPSVAGAGFVAFNYGPSIASFLVDKAQDIPQQAASDAGSAFRFFNRQVDHGVDSAGNFLYEHWQVPTTILSVVVAFMVMRMAINYATRPKPASIWQPAFKPGES